MGDDEYAHYLCYFNSWYHSLGFLSFLKENELFAANIIIVSGGFLGKKAVITTSDYTAHARTVVGVHSLRELEELLPQLDIQEGKICMVSASRYPYKLKKILSNNNLKAELLVVEEGLSSYGDYISGVKGRYRIAMASGGVKGWAKLFYSLVTSEVKRLGFMGVKTHFWFNFDKRTLELQPHVISGYRKALAVLAIEPDHRVPSFENTKLLISSPFCEIGLIDEELYINKLKRRFGGEPFFVKPHPAEDCEKYMSIGGIVLDSIMPIERMAPHLPHGCEVYSFSSTSTYTLRLFFGINPIRIPEMDFLYCQLSSRQKRIVDGHNV